MGYEVIAVVRYLTGTVINLKMTKLAMESSEEHGKINNVQEIFPCSSVDSVAMKNLARSLICTGTRSHQGPFE